MGFLVLFNGEKDWIGEFKDDAMVIWWWFNSDLLGFKGDLMVI